MQEFLARWRAGDWRRFQAKLLTVAVPPPASLLWGESRQPLSFSVNLLSIGLGGVKLSAWDLIG